MSQKPGDFFIGVIDLFVIILPGVFLNFIAYFAWKVPFTEIGKLELGGPANWTIFILSAYFSGHILSYFGTFVDTIFYGNDLRLIKCTMVDVRKCVLERIRGKLGVDFVNDKDVRRWAIAYLRTWNESATRYLDRKDADRRFFRNMILVLLVGLVTSLYYLFKPGSELNQLTVVSVILILLIPFCVLRYRDHQKKLTKQVFEFFISTVSAPAKCDDRQVESSKDSTNL